MAVETTDFSKEFNFAKKPRVSILVPKQIPSVKDMTGKLTDPQDITPMALAHLGLEFVEEENLTGRILKKVIRLMQI